MLKAVKYLAVAGGMALLTGCPEREEKVAPTDPITSETTTDTATSTHTSLNATPDNP